MQKSKILTLKSVHDPEMQNRSIGRIILDIIVAFIFLLGFVQLLVILIGGLTSLYLLVFTNCLN